MFGRSEHPRRAAVAAAAAAAAGGVDATDLSANAAAEAADGKSNAALRRELWRENQQQSVEDIPAVPGHMAAAAAVADTQHYHVPPTGGKTTYLYTPSRGGAG